MTLQCILTFDLGSQITQTGCVPQCLERWTFQLHKAAKDTMSSYQQIGVCFPNMIFSILILSFLSKKLNDNS